MEEKKLVVFCCENSSLVSARALQYDDEKGELFGAVRIVPLPCSGKIEMGIILKALEEGAPGVLVLGCPVDNCKFFRGMSVPGSALDR
ncbi:MAG: hydrogenase iron-sulfur subunit [Spirochaetales bacterium]|nr:MAG: hydrogenase iron-sulfur subunit [Spirochaetales bacterium]